MRATVLITATLILLQAVGAVKYVHDGSMVSLCQDEAPDKQFDIEMDWDEVLYMDFEQKKEIVRIPHFDGHGIQGGEASVSANIAVCKHNLGGWKKNSQGVIPEPNIQPDVAVFPEDNVEWGVMNTLICHAAGFQPAALEMQWLRNNQKVTEGVNITEYYMEEDFSFQRFTYLSFVPRPGDEYTCRVQHRSLDQPAVYFWGPEVPEAQTGAGTVICALGISLGIISAIVGIILLLKERQRLHSQQRSL
uniref:MHC class II protein alpha chain n=1 Tax=Callorhinchus milii TaxID=7868 RepID=K4GAB5_CALMI|nr:MHC class II protein alpha chain [Callorhinchus milii]